MNLLQKFNRFPQISHNLFLLCVFYSSLYLFFQADSNCTNVSFGNHFCRIFWPSELPLWHHPNQKWLHLFFCPQLGLGYRHKVSTAFEEQLYLPYAQFFGQDSILSVIQVKFLYYQFLNIKFWKNFFLFSCFSNIDVSTVSSLREQFCHGYETIKIQRQRHRDSIMSLFRVVSNRLVVYPKQGGTTLKNICTLGQLQVHISFFDTILKKVKNFA